ncbi:MAG: YmdB family metallophosphoesterase [Victivallales bacterium]|nr:YmdB family metallophosphoesterase [Victivallales bacterium]
MKLLFIGDIVGHGGREAAKQLIPALRQELSIDFCVANGENMAGGNGMTKPLLLEFNPGTVDVFTSGDHVWDQKEFPGQIDSMPNVLRPANLPEQQPGKGWGLYTASDGTKVGVINLLGRTFMGLPSNCPFSAAEKAVAELRQHTPVILVDFHAEATSEKIAMGRFLDGKVSAVFGTHTHVATADTQIFPGGTAFQCDAGMVGSRESILGRDIAPVLTRFTTGMPARFTVNENAVTLHGICVTIDPATGHATAIERIEQDFS